MIYNLHENMGIALSISRAILIIPKVLHIARGLIANITVTKESVTMDVDVGRLRNRSNLNQ